MSVGAEHSSDHVRPVRVLDDRASAYSCPVVTYDGFGCIDRGGGVPEVFGRDSFAIYLTLGHLEHLVDSSLESFFLRVEIEVAAVQLVARLDLEEDSHFHPGDLMGILNVIFVEWA